MKIFTIIFSLAIIASAFAQYEEVDFSKVRPINEIPGILDDKAISQVVPNIRSRRIVGGEEVVPHSHPYHTALLLTISPTQIGLCGGSILSVSRTITAAHCVEGTSSTTVIVGGHNIQTIESSQQRVTVFPANYRIHPNYNIFLNNDIAILLLPSNLVFNTFVQPTRLPTNFVNDLFVDETGRAIGHGITGNGQSTSPVLRKAYNTIISNAACASFYGNSVVISSVICMSTVGPRGACSSDSGGSLTVQRNVAGDKRPLQVGVLAFGGGSCEGQTPNGFMRLTSFLDWIAATV